MRFSIWPSPERPWQETLDLVRHCEATGWDGVYFADHFMQDTQDRPPDDRASYECWAVLAALAASTERLRLGTLVCGNTYRHPAVLASMAASVDQISKGRLLLGLGAGWQLNEHAAYGIELYDVRTRLDRFEEACAVITSLLSQPRTTFLGRHYELRDAPCQPGPYGEHLPLLVGGGGEKRTLRIAARYADEWNVWATPELFTQKSAVLKAHCDDLGRDPATIAKSTQALLFLSDDEEWLAARRGDIGVPTLVGHSAEVADTVGRYVEAGVDELIIPDFTMGSSPRRFDTCDKFMTEVAPAFR